MGVNSVLKGVLNHRLVVGSAIFMVMMAILLIASSFTWRTDRVMRAKQTNVAIRAIGHRLLLQAGDRTSRVLPVLEVQEGTFQLRFDHKFVFSHDSLMALSQGLLPRTQFPSGYTVTVHDCSDTKIVYGFQINNDTPDILACVGRSQPRGCYIIEFAFPDFYATPVNYPFIGLVSMLLFAGVTLLIGRFGKSSVVTPGRNQGSDNGKVPVRELSTLGKFQFDVKGQRLLLGGKVIALTDKECRILELLHVNFGELTPRETLMQVWVNEGVITGRSLDMFVSKLRKKLSADPGLNIANVHGKGYRLGTKYEV